MVNHFGEALGEFGLGLPVAGDAEGDFQKRGFMPPVKARLSGSIIHSRQAFDQAGFAEARIVASSGFDPQKCQVMGAAKAPVDIIGTGSFLPATLTETYATADVISYGGVKRVKVGREFLLD